MNPSATNTVKVGEDYLWALEVLARGDSNEPHVEAREIVNEYERVLPK